MEDKKSPLNYLKPIFPLGRIFGLIPYHYNAGISTFWLQYSKLLFLLLLFCHIGVRVIVALNPSLSSSGGGFRGLFKNVQAFIEALIVFSHTLKCFRKRDDLENILSKTSLIEHVKSGHKFVKVCFVVGILWPVLAQGIILAGMDFQSVQLIDIFLRFFGQISSFTIGMLFCGFIDLEREQFKKLRNLLVKDQIKRVDGIVDKHGFFIRLAARTNDFFSLQLFLVFLKGTINFVLNLFYTASLVVHNDKTVLSYLLYAGTAIWELFTLWAISATCSETSRKADKFNSELFKLMRDNQDLCNNEKLQLYVIVKDKNTFNACGFFSIGYPLITSVIAAATTYLVILVQFTMQ